METEGDMRRRRGKRRKGGLRVGKWGYTRERRTQRRKKRQRMGKNVEWKREEQEGEGGKCRELPGWGFRGSGKK